MCQTLRVEGRIISNMLELSEFVGIENILMYDYDDSPPLTAEQMVQLCAEASCLCGVDLPATGRRMGYRMGRSRKNEDPMIVPWGARKLNPAPPSQTAGSTAV